MVGCIVVYVVGMVISTIMQIVLANDACKGVNIQSCKCNDNASHFSMPEIVVLSILWPLVLVYLFTRYVPYNLYKGVYRLYRRAYSKYKDWNA